jgi:hypothetical protein
MKAEKGLGAAFWSAVIGAGIAAIGAILAAYIQSRPTGSQGGATTKPDFSVQGFVLEWGTNKIVSGAAIEVIFDGAPAPVRASTDSTGAYHFDLQASTPTVVVSLNITSPGYQNYVGNFTIEPGSQSNIFLTPIPQGSTTPASAVQNQTTGSAVLSGQDQFPGIWLNENRSTGSITRVEISSRLGQMLVHMWGSCQPVPCDWGTASASVSTGANALLTVKWSTSFHVVTQQLTLFPDGRLSVMGHTHFTDNSHRPDYDSKDIFVKQ